MVICWLFHIAIFQTIFDVTPEEKNAIWSLVDELKHEIRQKRSPDGYNIGMNIWSRCGTNDSSFYMFILFQGMKEIWEDPMGGVRGVIPEKQKY